MMRSKVVLPEPLSPMRATNVLLCTVPSYGGRRWWFQCPRTIGRQIKLDWPIASPADVTEDCRVAAVASSCRPNRHTADRDGGFGDDLVCLFRAPLLDGPLNRPRVLVSEAVGDTAF
jgi:hypothetical protein